MFSACGPERRRSVVRRELALDEVAVEVEEVQPVRLEPPVEDVGEQRAQRALRDRPAAEAGDDVVDGSVDAREREPDVLADDPADADRERLLDDDDPPRVAQRRRAPRRAGTAGST